MGCTFHDVQTPFRPFFKRFSPRVHVKLHRSRKSMPSRRFFGLCPHPHVRRRDCLPAADGGAGGGERRRAKQTSHSRGSGSGSDSVGDGSGAAAATTVEASAAATAAATLAAVGVHSRGGAAKGALRYPGVLLARQVSFFCALRQGGSGAARGGGVLRLW